MGGGCHLGHTMQSSYIPRPAAVAIWICDLGAYTQWKRPEQSGSFLESETSSYSEFTQRYRLSKLETWTWTDICIPCLEALTTEAKQWEQPRVHQWRKTECGPFTYRTWLSRGEEWSRDTCCNMGECRKPQAEWSQSQFSLHIVYKTPWKGQVTETLADQWSPGTGESGVTDRGHWVSLGGDGS